MNSETILKSDVLDIIFENRNKAYGAYALRKFYAGRLIKSLGFTMFAVLALSAFTLLPHKEQITIYAMDTEMATLPVVTPIKEKKAASKLIPKKKVVSQKRGGGTPVIVKNDKAIDTIKETIVVNNIGNNEIMALGEDNTGGVAVGGNDIEISGEGSKSPVALTDVTVPISNPEIMPEYPGGLNALKRFLQRNLQNPRDLSEGEMVSVKVKFVVGFDGRLKSFELVENGGDDFNKEVIRVLKKMPAWVPGKSKGRNVAVYYTIPVKFINED